MAEESAPGRRGERSEEAAAERGPGAAFHMFVLMEDLLDKLKLLSYEEEALRPHNMRPLSRHYFALPTNPGEQFFMFCTLAAWLISKAGRPFEQPQEYDDPNAVISSVLSELRSFGRPVDFPPSKLKTGCGEQVCYVLDCLAEEALKNTGFSWKRPAYPTEEPEEEEITEDDAELTLSKLEEDVAEEESDNEEDYIDLNVLKAQTYRSNMNNTAKQEEILQSTTDAAEWNLEVERVLPQLKVTVRTDNKDWRIHVDQMHQHKDGIDSSLKETRGYLDKLHNEISRTLEKINSREKYINNQLEHLVQEYRSAQALLSEAKEKYQEGSGGVTERIRVLSEITEALEKVKQETEEKGSSMTDGGSAQLSLYGTSVVEKNDCNKTVVLPCYVTDLKQNNENVMSVTWKRQGVTIFFYHGGNKNFNIDPSFSSARFLSKAELIKGVASLVIDSAQATVGNYSCKVTESNSEGEIKMELKSSSGSWFLLMERVGIVSLMCLLVILCVAQLCVIGLKYEIESQRLVYMIVALVIFAVVAGVGAALFFPDGYTVRNQAGLGLIVIPAVILVPLQYFMFGIVFDSLLRATLALIGLKLLGFIIAVVGFALCVSACPPLHVSVLIAGLAIMAFASLCSLVYVFFMGSRMKDHPRPGNCRVM
uniref:Intraflagellar transport protein 57 homolog n=1 Tax=Taeniopygia guttata TaxID=59729 RepID=A0A674HR09_TAEGU